MKFEQYHIYEGIKKAIAKEGYKKPTDIQYKSIPAILKGEDVLAIAQTGTGKTAAFVIPILHILEEKKIVGRGDGVKCLVMAPTHELAQQIEKVFLTIGKHTSIKILSIHGGVDQEPQIKSLNNGIDVLIATPGRMFDLVHQGALNLKRMEILVLDEADHMLDLGFIKDIKDLMRHIPKHRQTLFFSATINESIKKIAYSLVKNAIRIQISPKNPVAKNIKHALAFVEMEDKRFFLENLIHTHNPEKLLVFVRTKVRAERVKSAMQRVNIKVDTIHSDRLQKERQHTMKAFRSGDLKILITTDISARGIDIPNVDYVVNYDMPESSENYVHRVGRTGRGREKGKAISFCSSEEKKLLKEIEQNLDKPIQKIELSKGEYSIILDSSEESKTDWKTLMKEAQEEEENSKKLHNKRINQKQKKKKKKKK